MWYMALGDSLKETLMSSDTDPWESVKDEVVHSVGEAEKLFARWKKLVEDLAKSGDKDELNWTAKELANNLKSIGWDLEDLNDSIAVVEKDPRRFNINDAEVNLRKDFVNQTRKRIESIKDELSSKDAKAKVASNARSALMSGGASSKYAKLEAAAVEANDDFIEDQGQKQEQIMRKQDTQLQEVGATVGVLSTMGRTIADELDDQNRLLDEMESEIETTTERLKRTIDKVDKVLAISKDGKQSCCICLLILLLVVLISIYVS